MSAILPLTLVLIVYKFVAVHEKPWGFRGALPCTSQVFFIVIAGAGMLSHALVKGHKPRTAALAACESLIQSSAPCMVVGDNVPNNFVNSNRPLLYYLKIFLILLASSYNCGTI